MAGSSPAMEWGEVAVGNLAEAYERSVLLQNLEAERSKILNQKAGLLGGLLDRYRVSKLEELKLALFSEADWLAEHDWRAVDQSARDLNLGKEPIGIGFLICYAGKEERHRKRPAICVDFPFEQSMYRVFLDEKETETQQKFLFAKKVVVRIGELIFECDQLAKEAK